jgi:histidinol-phosphate aminotransferase
MNALKLIRPDLEGIPLYKTNNENLDCLLNANELPWAPPSSRAGISLNRYPTSTSKEKLQTVLADLYQVKPDEILITRGSDEGIDLLMRLFLRSNKDSIMQCPPTFAMYAFYARLQQATVINCPLEEKEDGFSLNTERLTTLWQPNCKLILLCCPNNPTGELLALNTIATLCKRYVNQSIIVVDEAYIEFSDAQSATSLINQFDNLIVLRTLSKAYGLAGLRLGAVIAAEPMIKTIQTICAPFTLSSSVLELGINALKDTAWFAKIRQCITQLRTKLASDLQSSPWIDTVYPSATNFLFMKTRYALPLAAWFLKKNIAIRSFPDNPQLTHYLRITVGDAYQNQQVLTALTSFTGEIR